MMYIFDNQCILSNRNSLIQRDMLYIQPMIQIPFNEPLICTFDLTINILDLLKSKYTVSESVSLNCSSMNGTLPSVPPPGIRAQNSDLEERIAVPINCKNKE